MSAGTTILAIDTSCDDTSVAVLQDDRVLSNIVSSQIDIHKEWGGVVPNLAKRAHQDMIDGCIQTALKRARITMEAIDLVAVTSGPGLAPALEVGIQKAKELATQHARPLAAVNHMEGHALSALLRNANGNTYSGIDLDTPLFPLLALCVSGGHTELVLAHDYGRYTLIGQTLDDAAGEAFDKVARMLDLGYPGGPIISTLAEQGDPTSIELPRPMQYSNDYNVSFSGLKTASMQTIERLKQEHGAQFPAQIPNMCASFQEAVVDSLCIKVAKFLEETDTMPRHVLLGGGVSANLRLRTKIRSTIKPFDLKLYVPGPHLSTDNAAMIGVAAWRTWQRHQHTPEPNILTTTKEISQLDRSPSWRIHQPRPY